MARPVNTENRELRQEQILKASRNIFCKKGYINVTMTDLIKASQMSRGGFYFYYKSVDEVFRDVVNQRKKSKFAEVLQSIEENGPFSELLDRYLAKQKERLLNLDNSLLRALYEYLFINQDSDSAQFRKEQKNNILETIHRIFEVGINQKVFNSNKANLLAEHFMYTIEGLNAMALFQGLTEDTIDLQFQILKQLLYS